MLELLERDDDAQTLRDALAFIDAWDAEENSSRDVTSSSTSTGSGCTSSSPDSLVSSSSPPLQRDQQASSSLRFRIVLPPTQPESEQVNWIEASIDAADLARKLYSDTSRIAASRKKGGRTPQTKEELVALRDQVARLEAQLVLLRERSARNSHHSESDGTWIRSSPAVELERVQRSLKRNRELKDVLAKQLQISRALKKLVLSKRVQHGLALLSEEPSPVGVLPRSFQSYAEDPTLVFAELYSNVKNMYIEAHSISQTIQSSCGISSVHLSSAISHDDVSSCAKLEISTNAPVAYNSRQLGRLFWSQIATPSDCIETGHYFTHAQSTAIDTYEKCYNMTRSSAQGDLSFRGTAVMRIFQDEAHPVVITYASLFAEINSGIVFRESSWFILTDLSTNSITNSSNSRSAFGSPPEALFQTFYRLTTDLKPPEDAQALLMQQFILKSMNVTMRNRLQQMQNMVTADAEVASLVALEKNSCLSVKCLR